MVTQQQVIQVEQQLTSQQQQFTQAKKQLQAQKIQFTRQQRQLPRQQRRLLQSRFQQQKQQSLQALRTQEQAFQKEISPVQSQLEGAKAGLRLQQEYEYGRKMARRGVVDPAFTKMMKRGYRGELSRIEYSGALIEQRAALKGLGGFQTITGEIQYRRPSGEVVYRIPSPTALSPPSIDPTTEAMPLIESAGLSPRAQELRQELIEAAQRDYIPGPLPEKKRFTLSFLPTTEKLFMPYDPKLFEEARKLGRFGLPERPPLIPKTKLQRETDIFFRRELEGQVVGGVKGYYRMAREEPLTFAALAGIGFVAPAAIAGIGWVGKTPLVKPLAKVVAKPLAKVALPVLAGLFLYPRGVAYAKAPTPEARGEVLGRTGLEVTALTAGALTYYRGIPKVIGFIRTRGRTYVPPKEVIDPQALAGKPGVPTAPRAEVLRQFKASKGVAFHATGKQWVAEKGKYIIRAGKKEFAGTYVAPRASAHFLRIAKEKALSYLGRIEPYSPLGTPTLIKFRGLKFKVTPFKITRIKPLKAVFTKPGEPGYVDIPLMKTEIEAIIRAGTEVTKIKGTQYTMWQGVRVPIDVFKIKPTDILKTKPGIAPKVPILVKGITSPYKPITPTVTLISPFAPTTIAPTPTPTRIFPTTTYVPPTTPTTPTAPPTYFPPSAPPSYFPPSAPPTYFPPTTPTYIPPTTPTYIPPSAPPSYPTYIPPTAPTYIPPSRPPTTFGITPTRRIKIGEEKVPGYKVWVKRKGKRVFLSGVFTRGEAILRGTQRTRQTLRATFGVVEAGLIRGKRRRIGVRPSPKIFRGYKIVKGKRVKLKDIWIQKAPYRLSARGEVREIITAKKRKGGKRTRWL